LLNEVRAKCLKIEHGAARLEEETADIANEASVRALRRRLDRRTIDMLFNAGIAKSITATPGTVPVQDFLDMMLVNAFGPMRLIEIFEDIVAPNGTIAAMSSELGSTTNNEGSWDLYASSKAALDMLMKCYTARRPADRRAKLLVAPGWIKTEMGGSDATFTVEECMPLFADMLEKNHGRACATSTGSTRRYPGERVRSIERSGAGIAAPTFGGPRPGRSAQRPAVPSRTTISCTKSRKARTFAGGRCLEG
jgi:NAD(P)-dependent dehydrogenase (short-subunit alcohol dehydrogenase family)